MKFNPAKGGTKFKIFLLVTSYGLSRMKLFLERRFGIPMCLFVVILLSGLVTLLGCDAFVRKFTRKPRKENLPQQELVLAPEEYKPPQMTNEEVYRQYFLYWKSWHDELINSLSGGSSHKKQIGCANEAIKNLEQLRAALPEAKQKRLDVYINQLKDLDKEIAEDLYGNDISVNRLTAERIRRSILREFSYNKIKDYLS